MVNTEIIIREKDKKDDAVESAVNMVNTIIRSNRLTKSEIMEYRTDIEEKCTPEDSLWVCKVVLSWWR
ncbi:MAG: hypothetical protein HFI93_07660 [Lachnospiraceae bacterium]|nr:hypothetical protein [Lachnospiraceae bacterium]